MSAVHREAFKGARGLSFGVVAALLLIASAGSAQVAGTATQTPAKPADPAQQQPTGSGAEVHTGTSSGLTTDSRIQILLADHQFLRVAAELKDLPPEEAQLYRGILANRDNDPRRSIDLLQPLLDKVTASGDVEHEKLLRKALAEDYLRDGNWTDAAKQYNTLESRLGSKLSQDEQDEIEMPLKLLPLAAANPPMTVDACDPFVMQVSRNPLGLTDVPVFVDARPHTFMLDPTAPFNLIARSLAREIGLKVSEEAATIHTLTGRPMQVHATLIPRFTVGGRLTFRNMTAFVFEDGDYAFPKSHYQVQGVLGYPALMALGSVTLSSNATLEIHPAREAGPDAKKDAPENGARFYLDGDQVIVDLGTAGNEHMFIVDAAGQQSYFTSRYYDEHMNDFAGQKAELFSVPSSQPMEPQSAYVAETLPLTVGATTVQVHFIQVLTHPLGNSVFDDVYGVLGMDVLDQLRSYTFDYRTMRFSASAE
jgi:hypothetical protein